MPKPLSSNTYYMWYLFTCGWERVCGCCGGWWRWSFPPSRSANMSGYAVFCRGRPIIRPDSMSRNTQATHVMLSIKTSTEIYTFIVSGSLAITMDGMMRKKNFQEFGKNIHTGIWRKKKKDDKFTLHVKFITTLFLEDSQYQHYLPFRSSVSNYSGKISLT